MKTMTIELNEKDELFELLEGKEEARKYLNEIAKFIIAIGENHIEDGADGYYLNKEVFEQVHKKHNESQLVEKMEETYNYLADCVEYMFENAPTTMKLGYIENDPNDAIYVGEDNTLGHAYIYVKEIKLYKDLIEKTRNKTSSRK